MVQCRSLHDLYHVNCKLNLQASGFSFLSSPFSRMVMTIWIVIMVFVMVLPKGSESKLIPIPNCNNETHAPCLYDPNHPLQPCSLLPAEFMQCKMEPLSCSSFVNTMYAHARVTGILNCTIHEGIECAGERHFSMRNVPCKRYSGYRFGTTLTLALFLGSLGADRFYTGHIWLGLIKLLSLGGVGVWWLLDLILLVVGVYYPADGSLWERYY